MRYSDVSLTVDGETARERVAERVSTLRTSTGTDRIEYRTGAGPRWPA